MERERLINTIYDRRSDNYKDIRHLTTKKKLTDRLNLIKTICSRIPENKKVSTNIVYKKYYWEAILIRMKLRVCYTEPMPLCLVPEKMVLLFNDRLLERRENNVEKASNKRITSLILLKYHLLAKSDDELQQIVDIL